MPGMEQDACILVMYSANLAQPRDERLGICAADKHREPCDPVREFGGLPSQSMHCRDQGMTSNVIAVT